ncbi:MAG: ArgR family transcriptional regulator [Actinobacteria bacterium]|nr:MAG: ArgR family transcriptional regulator [Actinomycetota bacterium]
MTKRSTRQDALRAIVRGGTVRTQQELVDRLRALGFECTQATVSRDAAEIGLRKLLGGGYVLAEDLHLHRMFEDLVTGVVRSQQLVLVKTSAGGAMGVAAALDAGGFEHVLGSIAGDDTVLLITESEAAAEGLVGALSRYAPRRGFRR